MDGQELISPISEMKRNNWVNLIDEISTSWNSQKALRLLTSLNKDRQGLTHAHILANQIARQLLINGRSQNHSRKPELETNNCRQLENVIYSYKYGKAAGLDDICVEQIEHVAIVTKK